MVELLPATAQNNSSPSNSLKSTPNDLILSVKSLTVINLSPTDNLLFFCILPYLSRANLMGSKLLLILPNEYIRWCER